MSTIRLPAWLRPAPDSAAARAMQRGKSPWTDAVHLLWTCWVFITPAFNQGYTRLWVGLTLLSYPVFLLLYWRVLVAPRRQALAYALAMGALALALMPWYPSGLTYFIYGCVFLRIGCKPVWHYLAQLGGMCLAFVATGVVVGYPWPVIATMTFMALVVSVTTNAEQLRSDAEASLRLSQDEVRRLAATAERERIGRDLHDLLGHTLSLITLKLELSRKLFDRDPAAARREVTEAERVARHALAEVRAAVTGIRATDIAAELASARLLLEASMVHVEYPPPPPLPVDIERALALVVREAATNIARHAGASRAHIAIVREERQACLEIRDNGRGGVSVDGNGLCGMRERVGALGGTLGIESPRGGGTRLRVCIPLPQVPERSADLPEALGSTA